MTALSQRALLGFAFPLVLGCSDGSESGSTPNASGGSAGAGGAESAGGAPASGGSAASGGAPDATGGAPEKPDASDGARSYPEETEEAIQAFVEAEQYRNPPWTPESPMPREEFTAVSPHDRVQVWLNDIAIASAEAGNGIDIDAPPHDTGSMAVKELYDADDQRVGIAAILKLDGDKNAAAYYCNGPPTRCGVSEVPFYGTGLTTECGFCHGGLLYTLTDAAE